MHELIRKEVEVITPEITYRGILVEVTAEEIHLQTPNAWVTIPMERVLDVKEVG
ncbi:MAG: hypothetical protein Fur0020_08830 [Thermodesulfovibrionia bacterium]